MLVDPIEFLLYFLFEANNMSIDIIIIIIITLFFALFFLWIH